MVIEVKLGSSMPAAMRARVGAWCDSRMRSKVIVSNREPLRSVDMSLMLDIVSVAVSVITLIVEVWPKEHVWDSERLASTTREALLHYGIVNFEIVNVENYGALTGANSSARCRVEVRDNRSNQLHSVLVRRDGSSFVVDLAAR